MVSLVYWVILGHCLTYDVGGSVNGQYFFSHTEEFSTRGRVIISSLVGMVGATVLFLLWAVLRKLRFLRATREPNPTLQAADATQRD
jgi:uncharacterized membrane protein YeaQ/YmgE (transglycosylase-associated protein family)